MRIDRFQMERTQCLYENEVEFNLSESGVQPLTARELLAGEAAQAAFLDAGLKYSQSNGTPELRANIASFYPGATASNVLVTTGTSEANSKPAGSPQFTAFVCACCGKTPSRPASIPPFPC